MTTERFPIEPNKRRFWELKCCNLIPHRAIVRSLASTLINLDRKDEARKYLDEIREDYPEAIDHRGRVLMDVIGAAE